MIVDDADVGYALETQTRPFYPGGVGTSTLVHEMAHQWYGDSRDADRLARHLARRGLRDVRRVALGRAHGGPTPAEHFDDLYAQPADDDLWHPAPTGFTDPADLFGAPATTAAR